MGPVPGEGSLDGAAVRDTIAAVFRGPAFAERSWAELAWLRLLDVLRALFSAVRGPGVAGPVMFWSAVAVLAALIAGAAVRLAARREALPRRRRAGAPGGVGDAWAEAEAAAGAGRYDVAAQRLYAGVVAALARAGVVRPHASKTAGDYLRELRRAGAPAAVEFAHAFAPFARGYQAVVYGPRAVDRARYEALRASARPLLERAAG